MLVQNSSTRYGPIHYNRIPSVSGRDAGRDPKEARGSSQDSSPKGNPADRYAFRTSPLRNVILQPTFFHNGAYTKLEDALQFHLDAISSARKYNRSQAGVDNDLRVGP